MTLLSERSTVERVAAELLRDVERLTAPWHPGAATLTRAIAAQAPTVSHATTLLGGLGAPMSGVNSRLDRLQLPSVKEQLTSFRLSLVLRLARIEPKVEAVAGALNFGAGPSLNRHCRVRCGCTAGEFIASWNPEQYWTEVVGPFMLWDDDRWTTLDPLNPSATVVERRPVRLAHTRTTRPLAVVRELLQWADLAGAQAPIWDRARQLVATAS